jgi:hypothetical protein
MHVSEIEDARRDMDKAQCAAAAGFDYKGSLSYYESGAV